MTGSQGYKQLNNLLKDITLPCHDRKSNPRPLDFNRPMPYCSASCQPRSTSTVHKCLQHFDADGRVAESSAINMSTTLGIFSSPSRSLKSNACSPSKFRLPEVFMHSAFHPLWDDKMSSEQSSNNKWQL